MYLSALSSHFSLSLYIYLLIVDQAFTFNCDTSSEVCNNVKPSIWSTIAVILGSAAAAEPGVGRGSALYQRLAQTGIALDMLNKIVNSCLIKHRYILLTERIVWQRQRLRSLTWRKDGAIKR